MKLKTKETEEPSNTQQSMRTEKQEIVKQKDEKQIFAAYMRNLRKKKHERWNEIAEEIGVRPKRIYKLISGEKRTRNRDLLILIGICLHESIDEMQEMLELYGLPVLTTSFKRDELLMQMVSEGIYEIDQINLHLESEQEEILKAYVRPRDTVELPDEV